MSMTTLDWLLAEHKLLGMVLDAADVYAAELEEDPRADLGDLALFSRFLTDFAELWHQAKEEEFLLPEMVRHGLAWDDGPAAHARREHEQETYLGRVLAQLAAQAAPRFDELEHRREVIAALRAYAAHQRHHIEDEETTLYPLARELLPRTALEDVSRRCGELESRRFSGNRYEDMCRAAELLVERHHEVERDASPLARERPHRRMPDLFGRATAVLGDHALLRATVERLRVLCARMAAEEAVLIDDVRQAIEELGERLIPHFAAEEADGYFGTLAVESPNLEGAILRLRAQHRELTGFIESLRAGVGQVDEMELAREIESFVATLTAHEREESALIGRYFEQQEGAHQG